jgi:FimV-like protein
MEFNRGFPEALELSLPPPLQESSLFSVEALENHFWLLAGALMLFLLAAALFWVRRRKARVVHRLVKTNRQNFPYKNEMSLMLTLAKQYHEAGYSENAIQLLNTVLAHGNEAEGDEAFQLITQIQKENAPDVNHVF